DRSRKTFHTARCRGLPSRSTSRSNSRLFLVFLGAIRLPELDATAFLHVIAGVHRELGDDVALDHRLAAEARVGRQIPGGIEAIELVVLLFAEILLTLADIQMTRGARAAAAAGVLERNVEVH